MLKFFAEKMWVAFAVQELLTFFQQKNIRILYIESAKTVNEMTLNELVKLTTLWTTGPWFFIPHHTIVVSYYDFTLVFMCPSPSVPLSVHPSIFSFQKKTWVNVFGFSPNMVYALILWGPGLGLQMGKFHQFLSVIICQRDNWNKCQWIFTKLGMHINNLEIWFGIASGQVSLIFDRVICPGLNNGGVLSFQIFIFLRKLSLTFLVN